MSTCIICGNHQNLDDGSTIEVFTFGRCHRTCQDTLDSVLKRLAFEELPEGSFRDMVAEEARQVRGE